MWKQWNENPIAARVGDCTVRAVSKALRQSWQKTYLDLCLYGFMRCDMPSANKVWGSYLKDNGFTKHFITEEQSVCEFANEHRNGTYLLALNGHVVAVVDGDYYDTWDCGGEYPIYYWEENKNELSNVRTGYAGSANTASAVSDASATTEF